MDLKPYYGFKGPNECILLARDQPCSFHIDQKELKGLAEVLFDFRFRPEIKFNIQCDLEVFHYYDSLTSKDVCITLNDRKIPVFATNIPISGSPKITFVPKNEPISWIGDNNTKLSKVVFHLFNFNDTMGTSRPAIRKGDEVIFKAITEMSSIKWRVVFENCDTSKTLDKLNKTGGYGLTHVSCFNQGDGTLFDGSTATQMLENLYLFFSFSKGSFCSPILPVGFDENENIIWALLNHPRETGTNPPFSWFDPHHCEQLAELFPHFITKLEDENWRDTLNKVIYWYARSNNVSASGIDTGIILTQIAIERLSFEYAVNHKKMIEANGFKDLKASDKFRLLFASLDIPTDIPSNLSEIKAIASRFGYIDAPYFLTEVRNSMVHPEHKREDDFSDIYYDAWRLGLWYLELAILRLCNYNGTYFNRLSDELWVGKVEKVPWVKEVKTDN